MPRRKLGDLPHIGRLSRVFTAPRILARIWRRLQGSFEFYFNDAATHPRLFGGYARPDRS
jgi:hypothetical protein